MTRVIFDIGGTNLRVALAKDGKPARERKVPTPPEPAAAVEAIRAYVAEIGSVDEVIGGIAGLVQDGIIIDGPNLPSWNAYDLAAALREACGIPSVTVLNDAAAAGIGEAIAGAGQGKRVVAYVTASTGVGGSLTIDSRAVPSAGGFEPGKQIIDVEHVRSLDSIISGAALAREFGKPAVELPRDVYDERTKPFAVGLYNLVACWSPDIIVLGGSLMNEDNGYRIGDLTGALKTIPTGLPLPPLVHSAFGDATVLYGAALFKD